MTPDDGLFPEPQRMQLQAGDSVVVHTPAGDMEATFVEMDRRASFPVVRVLTPQGDIAVVSIGLVSTCVDTSIEAEVAELIEPEPDLTLASGLCDGCAPLFDMEDVEGGR